MTKVADQLPTTQRGSSPVQSGANSNPSVLSNVLRFLTHPPSLFDVVAIGTESVPVQKGEAQFPELNKAVINRRLTVPGQFSPGSTDYTNRPSITVVKVTSDSASLNREVPLGSYADWFLSSVQEQDMERTDVIETFGAPHIFTSGRFTRKMVFSGLVRTTAHNFQSNITINRVPQHVLLRNFYENFLRSTAQAQSSTFSRIFIDGDIYEGYCTGLQLPRDAGVEMVMQFALTMIVVRRYNIHDADAKAALSKFVTAKVSRLTPSFATAEMKDAVGDFTMSLEVANAASGSSISINTGKVKQDGTMLGVPPVINLNTSFGGQTIIVGGTGAGIWTLKYADDGAPVSGSPSRGGSVPLKLELASYAKLVAVGAESNGAETLTLTLSAVGKEGLSMRVTSITTDNPQLKIKSMNVTLQSTGARFNGVTKNTFLGSFDVTDARKGFVQTSPGVWDIIFDIAMEISALDGVTLAEADLPSPVASYCNVELGGQLTLNRGGNSFFNTIPSDAQIASTPVDLSNLVVDSIEPGIILFQNIKFTLHTTTDVSQVNPFVLAESIDLNLQPKMAIPGYDPLNTGVAVTLLLGKSNLLTTLFDGISVTPDSVRKQKWGFLPRFINAESSINHGRPYTSTLTIKKSANVQKYNISNDIMQSMLRVATLVVQYNIGSLSVRPFQYGAGALQVGGKTHTFRLTADLKAQDATSITMDCQFIDSSATDAETFDQMQNMLSIIGNPVSVALEFPPAYNVPRVTGTFK